MKAESVLRLKALVQTAYILVEHHEEFGGKLTKTRSVIDDHFKSILKLELVDTSEQELTNLIKVLKGK